MILTVVCTTNEKNPHKLNLSTSWHFSIASQRCIIRGGLQGCQGPRSIHGLPVHLGGAAPFDDQGIIESSNHPLRDPPPLDALEQWLALKLEAATWTSSKKNVLQMVIHVFFLWWKKKVATFLHVVFFCMVFFGWKQRLLEKLPLSCMGLPHLISWQVIEKHRVQARGDSYRSAGQSAGTRAPKNNLIGSFSKFLYESTHLTESSGIKAALCVLK